MEIHTMKDRSDNPSHHERTLIPRSYTSLLGHHMEPKELQMEGKKKKKKDLSSVKGRQYVSTDSVLFS